jgi:phage-related minor tail protein
MQSTAGPWEQAQMDFSDLSEEMEHLKVQGVMGVADAFTTLLTNTENWKDATISAIKQVIAEFIRLQTMKFLMNLASSAMGVPGGGSMMGGGMGGGMSAVGGMSSLFGGVDPMFLTGFATGGSFNVMGRSGVDRNMLSLNGLPIAKVSRGERVSVGTNQQPMGGNTYNMPLNFHGPVSRETMMQAGAKVRAAVASSNRKGA